MQQKLWRVQPVFPVTTISFGLEWNWQSFPSGAHCSAPGYPWLAHQTCCSSCTWRMGSLENLNALRHYCFHKKSPSCDVPSFSWTHHEKDNPVCGSLKMFLSLFPNRFSFFPAFTTLFNLSHTLQMRLFFLCAAVSLHLSGVMMGQLKHLTFLNFHDCSAERQGGDTITIKAPPKTCFIYLFIFFLQTKTRKLLQE